MLCHSLGVSRKQGELRQAGQTLSEPGALASQLASQLSASEALPSQPWGCHLPPPLCQ